MPASVSTSGCSRPRRATANDDDARDPGKARARERRAAGSRAGWRSAARAIARVAAYRIVSTIAPSPSTSARTIGPSGPDADRGARPRRDRRRSTFTRLIVAPGVARRVAPEPRSRRPPRGGRGLGPATARGSRKTAPGRDDSGARRRVPSASWTPRSRCAASRSATAPRSPSTGCRSPCGPGA